MIKIFITGGTIDCEKIDEGGNYSFGKTAIPSMFEQGRCKTESDFEVLMMKDSLYMTDQDRAIILEKCKNCKEDKIIITHGTDTMAETAKLLGGGDIENKTIVLVGAMVPFDQEKSDALFNLGSAMIAVQILNNGVYITMNGTIFSWDNVRKNKDLLIFETLKK